MKLNLKQFLSGKNYATKKFLTKDLGEDFYIVITPRENKKPFIRVFKNKSDIKNIKYNSSVIIIKAEYNATNLPKTKIIVTEKNKYLDKCLIVFSLDDIADTYGGTVIPFKIPPRPKVNEIENPNRGDRVGILCLPNLP